LRKLPLLAFERSPSPDEVIKRAEVWKKIFDAKDRKEPIEVVITKKVRQHIYEILFEGVVRGLIKSPKEHSVGETVKAKIVIADYAKRKLRTKLYEEGKELLPGAILKGKVVKVSKDGLIVSVGDKKVLVPKNKLGPARTRPLKDLKGGEVECLILRVEGGKAVGEILKFRI